MTTLVTSMFWDCFRSNIWTRVWGLAAAALVSAVLLCAMASQAAEPDFVGVLALALEAEVAEKIRLSEQARAKLLEVVDRRENEALEIALQIRDLPLNQRAAKLAPFRAESERQGLAFLSERQRQALRAVQITRMGMASLAEPDVVGGVELSPALREDIGRLLEERAQAMAKG